MLKLVERLRSRLLGSTSVGLVIVLALSGTVAALTATDFTYSTTKTGYYSIHPMDMAPEGNGAASNYSIGYINAELFGTGCYSTGVHVPQGSRITQLVVAYSSGVGDDPGFFLYRSALSNGSFTGLVDVEVQDDTDTRKLAVLPILGGPSLVSNIGFTYGFAACPGLSGIFNGARIAYTYTSAGD